VDVREHTAASDGHTAEELVELFVVAHSELHVARDDARLLVVARRVARKLEDFSAEVLEDRREVHGGAGTHAGGVLALLQETAHAGYRELKASLGRLGSRFATGLATAAFAFSFARHFEMSWLLSCA